VLFFLSLILYVILVMEKRGRKKGGGKGRSLLTNLSFIYLHMQPRSSDENIIFITKLSYNDSVRGKEVEGKGNDNVQYYL